MPLTARTRNGTCPKPTHNYPTYSYLYIYEFCSKRCMGFCALGRLKSTLNDVELIPTHRHGHCHNIEKVYLCLHNFDTFPVLAKYVDTKPTRLILRRGRGQLQREQTLHAAHVDNLVEHKNYGHLIFVSHGQCRKDWLRLTAEVSIKYTVWPVIKCVIRPLLPECFERFYRYTARVSHRILQTARNLKHPSFSTESQLVVHSTSTRLAMSLPKTWCSIKIYVYLPPLRRTPSSVVTKETTKICKIYPTDLGYVRRTSIPLSTAHTHLPFLSTGGTENLEKLVFGVGFIENRHNGWKLVKESDTKWVFQTELLNWNTSISN